MINETKQYENGETIARTYHKKVSSIPDSSNHNNEILFDLNGLYDGEFKRLVSYNNEKGNSPLEYILTNTITVLSGIIGKLAYFQHSNYNKTYLNIWAVLIGKSSIMYKTSSIDICTYEVKRINKQLFEKYESAMSGYNSLPKPEQNKITVPVREYLLLPNNFTSEALTDVLKVNVRGLIQINEFGGLLELSNKSYGGGLKSLLTDIYDVPDNIEISRATKGNTLLQNPYCSVLGSSTIEWITKHINQSDVDSGFMPRFLFSIRNVNDKKHIPLLELSNIKFQHSNYEPMFLYDKLMKLENDTILSVNDNAKKLHNDYSTSIYDKLNSLDHDGKFNAFYVRLVKSVLKIAGIVALVNDRTEVNAYDMQDALLIGDYYKKNFERLLNYELQITEYSKTEQRIIDIIRRSENQTIKHSDLFRLSNIKISKVFNEHIQNLLQKDVIDSKQKEGTVRPYIVYFLK